MSNTLSNQVLRVRLEEHHAALFRWVVLAALSMGGVAVEAALATPQITATHELPVHLVAAGFFALGLIGFCVPTSLTKYPTAVSWVLVVVCSVQISVLVAVARGAPTLPLFYAWPLMAASFLMTRSHFVGALAFGASSYAVALLPTFQGGSFAWTTWVLVMVALTFVLLAVRLLSESSAKLLTEVRIAANFDPLTGVLNRRSFGQQSAALWAGAHSDGDLVALVLDLDHFKSVNDQFGHAAGDTVLRTVGEVLRETFPSGCLVARMGGEEFAVLCPGSDVDDALVHAEAIRSRLREVEPVDGVKVTVSIGIADSGGASGVESLLDIADRATYAAKRAGRDRVVVAGAARLAA